MHRDSALQAERTASAKTDQEVKDGQAEMSVNKEYNGSYYIVLAQLSKLKDQMQRYLLKANF